MYTLRELAQLNRHLVETDTWNEVQMKEFSKYYYGLSYGQAMRLIKALMPIHSKVNLDIDRLEESYVKFEELMNVYNSDHRYSINYYVYDNGVGLIFPYNLEFTNVMKTVGKYDKKNGGWIISVDMVNDVIKRLENKSGDCMIAKEELNKLIIPFLEKKIEGIRLKQKQEEEQRIVDERNRVTFVGKSPNNEYGQFQAAQKKFHDQDVELMKAYKTQKKLQRKEKLKDILRIVTFKN